MKGYSPTFEVNPNTEVASKKQHTFIELGIKKPVHENDCKCDICINKENT